MVLKDRWAPEAQGVYIVAHGFVQGQAGVCRAPGPMGNSALCGGAPQRCVEECTRLHGETRSRDLEEEQECDPAGAVFSETLRGLPSLDQEALRFAGSPNLAAVRWLLALGANPKARDSSGTTLLHAACRSGSCLIVQELVKQGLPLDAQDNSGWTPLHITAVMGRRDLALLLVRVRANISVRNKKGALPVSMCTDPGTKEVLEEFCTGSGLARPHPKPFLADMLVMNPGVTRGQAFAPSLCGLRLLPG